MSNPTIKQSPLEDRFMKLYDSCVKRILLAYQNGELRSHVVLPVLMFIMNKTGYADSHGQFAPYSAKEIAESIGSSKTSVVLALQSLKNLGIIYHCRYGYALNEEMAYKGTDKHQGQLKAVRLKLMKEDKT